jgi:hypothetical protein
VSRAGPDFYPTPPWATHALIDNEAFAGEIWECACGDGRMAEVLALTGNPVYGSDLNDYGYGEAGIDFLLSTRRAANIVTNPPFKLVEEFVLQALRLAERKVAMLVRLAFLESAKRFDTIFQHTPPSRTWVYSERITFYPGGIQTAGSGPGAHAWVVWDKGHVGPPELRWLSPGYKARYGEVDAAGDAALPPPGGPAPRRAWRADPGLFDIQAAAAEEDEA